MSDSAWMMRRLAGAVVVWLLVSALSFSLGSLAPGDPAQAMLLHRSGDPPSEVEVQRLRHQLGLDRPFGERYLRWLGAAAQGDLGRSYRTGQPVLRELWTRFPATLALAITALALGLVIAVPLAVVAVAARGTAVDHAARLVALSGVSTPSYLVGYLLILLFAVTLGLLPVSGAGSARHLVLPGLTLGLGSAASVTRVLRANLLEELGADYVRTARAKGLSGSLVLTRHVLRNALNPLVTISAMRATSTSA